MSNWTQSDRDAYYERLKARVPADAVGVDVYAAVGNGPERKIASADFPKPRMNKTEAAYAQELENQKRVGLISWWAFEPMKLRLADKTYYTPDFAVMNRERPVAEDGVYVVAGPPKPDERRFYWREALEFHEVKGFWRDDARVKIKVAAEHFPFKFVAVRKKKLSEGGGWDVEEFCGSHS